jgi:Putative auto-transporter adhesin, head GIN domain
VRPTAFIAALLLAAPAGAAQRGFSVTDFDRVRVVGGVDVTIAKARMTAARATGSRESLDALSVEVIDRELVIRVSARTGTATADLVPPAVFISVPAVSRVRVMGNGTVRIDELAGANGNLSLSGNGTVSVARVAVDRGSISLSGAGTITASGTAKLLTASVLGTGSVEAAGLSVADLTLNSSTSGSVAFAATRSAKVIASGAGDVRIGGNIACVVRNAGSGNVTCGRAPSK